MTKEVAVMDSNVVVAINLWDDSYELQENELLVTNPAFIGGEYIDGYFYSPQPFPSWIRHEGLWLPPKPRPDEDNPYYWDEEAQEWVSVEANA